MDGVSVGESNIEVRSALAVRNTTYDSVSEESTRYIYIELGSRNDIMTPPIWNMF